MGELDKVRSILFGEQVRAYEERLQRMENDMKQHLSSMSADLDKKIKALDDLLNARHEEILGLLGEETSSRAGQKESLLAEIQKVSDALADFKDLQEKRLEEMGKSIDASMKSESARLEQAMVGKMKSMSSDFKATTEKLDVDKISRTRIAELLAGVAREIDPRE